MDKFYNFNQVFPKLFLEVYKKYTQKFEKGKHKWIKLFIDFGNHQDK